MKSDEIEEALPAILGHSAASPGLVITLRRHDEYEELILRIRALEAEQRALQLDLSRMSHYPVLYLQALDELRCCRKILQQLGVDTSFIGSLRSKR